MADLQNPTIFLSYAWKNSDIADAIDNDFKSIGITFKRDIRDLPYRSSIKEFMHQVSKSNFALMIISDAYLKSENCLYEATELLNSHEFEKRILPIVLDDASKIFKLQECIAYYNFWQEKLEEITKIKKKLTNLHVIELEKKYKDIYNNLATFFTLLTNLNASSYKKLERENYRSLLNIIGFEDKKLLEKIIAISRMRDLEERELELERFIEDNPNNRNALILKAETAYEKSEYKKARRYYENLLSKYPLDINAYKNLGLLLASHFTEPDDYRKALQYYQDALKIDADNSEVHYNLAILLDHRFNDHYTAKKHYEISLTINTQFALAYLNLGILLKQQLSDPTKSKELYAKAISLDPSLQTKKRDKIFDV